MFPAESRADRIRLAREGVPLAGHHAFCLGMADFAAGRGCPFDADDEVTLYNRWLDGRATASRKARARVAAEPPTYAAATHAAIEAQGDLLERV